METPSTNEVRVFRGLTWLGFGLVWAIWVAGIVLQHQILSVLLSIAGAVLGLIAKFWGGLYAGNELGNGLQTRNEDNLRRLGLRAGLLMYPVVPLAFVACFPSFSMALDESLGWDLIPNMRGRELSARVVALCGAAYGVSFLWAWAFFPNKMRDVV